MHGLIFTLKYIDVMLCYSKEAKYQNQHSKKIRNERIAFLGNLIMFTSFNSH